MAGGMTLKELTELAIRHDLDRELVLSRYRRGKRGKDLTAPRMTNSQAGRKGAKRSIYSYRPAVY